jgi:hypothetical protein
MRPRVVRLLLLAAVVGACAAPRDRGGTTGGTLRAHLAYLVGE